MDSKKQKQPIELYLNELVHIAGYITPADDAYMIFGKPEDEKNTHPKRVLLKVVDDNQNGLAVSLAHLLFYDDLSEGVYIEKNEKFFEDVKRSHIATLFGKIPKSGEIHESCPSGGFKKSYMKAFADNASTNGKDIYLEFFEDQDVDEELTGDLEKIVAQRL